jgi:hypothetical protein
MLTTWISNKKKLKATPSKSDLISGWKSKLSAAAPCPSKTSSKAKHPVETTSPLGGLEDEDVFADISDSLTLSKGQATNVHCFHI